MISTDRLVVRNLWWLLWLTKASLYVVLIEMTLAQMLTDALSTRPGVSSHGLLFLQLWQVHRRQ